MRPGEVKAGQFRDYPPQARQLATGHLALLDRLPGVFAALLLRELIAYDWKFPAERRALDRQLAYLESLAPEDRAKLLAGFADLKLSKDLEEFDWVREPVRYSEQFTAHLWATHQIGAFRRAAVDYMARVDAASPQAPPAMRRLGMVVIGQGVAENRYPLFRKLRKQGVYFKRVDPADGVATLVNAAGARAADHPEPYAHWYIDGGAAAPVSGPALTCVSYDALGPARLALRIRVDKAIHSGSGGPEALRTMMAQMRPEEVGLGGPGRDLVPTTST